MEKKLKTSLQAAVAFLEKQGIRYAVIGGIALAQWGVVRVTRDIDIKVLVPETNYDTIRFSTMMAAPWPCPTHMVASP